MSNLVWPVTLPQNPRYDGLQYSYKNNTITGKTDTGPGKFRQRYSRQELALTLTLILDAGQVDTLMNFYRDDTAGGALSFIWNGLTDMLDFNLWGFQGQTPPRGQILVKGQWAMTLNLETRLV